MIGELEALALDIWRPAECEARHGWTLCWSGGFTRRINSVQTSGGGPAGTSLDECIEDAEEFYRARGVAPVFKLTGDTRPEGLERALARRGYRLGDPTSVQTAPLDGDLAPDAGVALESELDEEWFEASVALNRVSASRREAYRAVLGRLPPRRAFVALRDEGRLVAQALGAVHDGTLFLGEVATEPSARRRGLARRAVASLLAWGRDHGARRGLLQVVASNAPARALYAELGFGEVYTYWYRQREA